MLRHAEQDVHDLPRWAVALGVVAAAASLVAWALLVRTGGWFGVLVGVVGTLVVGSIAILPALGVLLLVLGVVGMASAQQRARDKRALVAGLVIAVAVPAAALVASDGPVVRCRANGASTSSSLFRGSSSESGSGSSSAGPSGTATGRHTSGGRRYTFRCEGGRLVEFRATDAR